MPKSRTAAPVWQHKAFGGIEIKAILFDIDGTILRCQGAGKRSLESATMDVFGTTGLMDEVHFQGKTDPLIIYEALLPAGVEADAIRENMEALKERYLAYLQKNIMEVDVVLLPGVRELLDELDGSRDVIVGLLTGNFSMGARIKLSAVGLEGRFPFGVYGDDTCIRNEMPGIARRRIKDLTGDEVDFTDLLVVGDTIYDIECGKSSGAISMAVGTGWTDEKELLLRNPDLYFRDLSDTPRVLSTIGEALCIGPAG